MIDAAEVMGTLRLPTQDEAEVRRVGAEVVARLRDPAFDGTTVTAEVPCGEGEEQHRRSFRIACAVQREFQLRRWTVFLEPFVADAFGRPKIHRLSIMIDAAAVRAAQDTKAVTNGNGHTGNGHHQAVSLRSLAEELSEIYGTPTAAQPLPGEIDVSVILGTYNRLALLKHAVGSVRDAVGNLTYEIVVVDGGSWDGSRAWLAAQPDVVMVGERRLEGAVRAFNQAYALARGRYIANFNDDAEYVHGALTDAIQLLHERSEFGQVALKFRDRSQGKETVNAAFPNDAFPEITWGTIYANFGVVRRVLADRIVAIQGGFWSPEYRTYAADVEFSAWVWRLGSRVAPMLDKLRVEDMMAEDDLRRGNEQSLREDTWKMHRRWPADAWRPDGPDPKVTAPELARFWRDISGARDAGLLVDGILAPPNDDQRLAVTAEAVTSLERGDDLPARSAELTPERVLHVSLATDADPQTGLCRALVRWSNAGQPIDMLAADAWDRDDPDRYRQINWTTIADCEARERAILEAAGALRPTLVFMQLQTNGVVSDDLVRQLRLIADPRCVVVSWNGDIGAENSVFEIDWQIPMARSVDLCLHSSLAHVRALRAKGATCAAYLQIGYDDQQYRPPLRPAVGVLSNGASPEGTPIVPFQDCGGVALGDCRADGRSYDVAFLGNKYEEGNPFLATLKWHDSALRDEVVAKMRESHGWRFALHGNGWGRGSRPIALSRAHEAYQRAKVGLSVSLMNDLERYSSDRLLRILGCGALALVRWFPGMSTFGLQHGTNCLVWKTPDEAVELSRGALAADTDHIREAGAALAREHHTWDVRVLEMKALVDAARAAK